MINKALDLPFDDPQETYSTSENLFHDLGIPAGTRGRIVDPAPPAPREDRPSRDRAPRERAPRSRTRQRTRTRSGAQVTSDTASKPAAPGEQASAGRPAGQSRNRRRRRRSGSSSGAGPESAAS